MKKRYDREYYAHAIRTEKKTLTEIAQEAGVSVNTIKSRIKKSYQRKAWAERLISIALENEKDQKEKQRKAGMVLQSKVCVTEAVIEKNRTILVDTSMLLNYPEVLQEKKDAKLLVPRFCWHTALKIVEGEKKTNPSLASKHEKDLSDLDVEEIFVQSLPYIHRVPENVKPHSVMFLKYLVKLRETYPSITTLTCSREIKEVASLNGITL